MSTCPSAASSAYEPYPRAPAMPSAAAKLSARSEVREPTATTSASTNPWSTRTKSVAMVPVPMMPHRTARRSGASAAAHANQMMPPMVAMAEFAPKIIIKNS
eukprot:scaffold19757_cov113-Isochrysis_galbana.AAC.8